MKISIKIIALIGTVFTSIASIIAFMITYQEYSHHYPTRKEPLKLASETDIFTFLVFSILTILAGLCINLMF